MKNKFFSIALSVVVAFSLWLYVIMVVSPGSEKTYYNIPVILQNEQALKDRGLMITSELPKITLTLSGTRTDLNKLDENNINILVDVSAIEAPGTHRLNYMVSYPGSVSSGAITRVGQSTNAVSVKVEKILSKDVDVVVDDKGTVAEGFLADRPQTIYQTIEVSGPESVVSKITQAKISIDLTDKNQTIAGRFSYELCDVQGNVVTSSFISTNMDDLDLTIKIIPKTKQVPFKIKVIDGGGLTKDDVTVTIPEPIQISGNSVTQLESFTEITLDVDLAKNPAGQVAFPITLPEGLVNESGVSSVTVVVTPNG